MPSLEGKRLDLSSLKPLPKNREVGGGVKMPETQVNKRRGVRSYEEVLQEALKDPRVKAEYDALEPQFQLQRALMLRRGEKGMSRQDVAERLKTTPDYIAGIEHGHVDPSFSYLVKLAEAMDADLAISFRPREDQGEQKKPQQDSTERQTPNQA
jgi:ribosome-binding protein aMBF1 (putative translation factor)